MSEPSPPSRAPDVSLCMIVKDEESRILSCLASAAAAAGQMVVLDTGSSDRTAALAAAAGAEVASIPWTGDFSAARNASLALARGRWILALDADEALAPGAADALAAALRAAERLGNDAVFLDVAEADGEGRVHSVSRQCRLFRNSPAIRYAGRVHETPAGWTRPGHAPVAILHYGYYGVPPEARAAKAARNAAILRGALAASPDDWVLHWQLARELCATGEFAEAAAAGRRALEAFARAKGAAATPPAFALETAVRGALGAGDLPSAGRTLAAARALHPDHPVFAYFQCRVAALSGDWEGVSSAALEYRRLLARHRAGLSLSGEVEVPGLGHEAECVAAAAAAEANAGRPAASIRWISEAYADGLRRGALAALGAIAGRLPDDLFFEACRSLASGGMTPELAEFLLAADAAAGASRPAFRRWVARVLSRAPRAGLE